MKRPRSLGLLKRADEPPHPRPYSFPASELFEGNDGTWSTFLIRVGTPEQTFRVLISTSSQETWIPVPEGCLPVDPSNCGTLRGVQPFQSAPSSGFSIEASSSWESAPAPGIFQLTIASNLNYTGNGIYGWDTIGTDLPLASGITLKRQIVAGIATKDFPFGYFPLGEKPTNFTDFNNPQPSYIASLKNQSYIPSLSYGYTAGSYYQGSTGAVGSLTFGGYDLARLDMSKSVSVGFPNTEKQLTLALQGIMATDTLIGTAQLLPRGIFTLIESTVPEIWLPLEACHLFERAFGLEFDNRTHRYLVNDTVHQTLRELDPVLNFRIANTTSGGQNVNIELPYSAFNLQASWPLYPNKTNYFPLRRSDNATQYTLGRTFLQEAYLIVDYERSNFTVAQSVFNPGAATNLVTIEPCEPREVPKKSLSTGSIVGIVVGAVVGLALIIALAFLLYRRHKRRNQPIELPVETTEEHPHTDAASGQPRGAQEPSAYTSEVEAHKPVPEVQGSDTRTELGGGQAQFPYEVEAYKPAQEVHAVHVSELDSGWTGYEVSDRPRTAEMDGEGRRAELPSPSFNENRGPEEPPMSPRSWYEADDRHL